MNINEALALFGLWLLVAIASASLGLWLVGKFGSRRR
jgi:hypothetical protein